MNRFHSLALPTLAFSLVLLAPSAPAHPGHSLSGSGAGHLLTSPDHLVLLALLGAALWFGGRFIGSKLPRLSMQGLGVLTIIAAGVLFGLRA